MSTALGIADGGTGEKTVPGVLAKFLLRPGVDIQAYDDGLQALADFNTDGFIVQTAEDTYVGREITGTASEVTVTNGDGVAGDPVVSLPTALTFTGKTITGGTYASGVFNGTVGAITPNTGSFTTLNAGLTTLRSGTVGVQSSVLGLAHATDQIVWRAVLEANESLTFYSYDVSTGAYTGTGLNIQNGGTGSTIFGDLVITGDLYQTGALGASFQGNVYTTGAYLVDSVQVVGNRNTGWAADTGTAKKTSNATYTAPTISNPPTQAEVQAIANAVQNNSRTIKSLKDALIAHGLIGT